MMRADTLSMRPVIKSEAKYRARAGAKYTQWDCLCLDCFSGRWHLLSVEIYFYSWDGNLSLYKVFPRLEYINGSCGSINNDIICISTWKVEFDREICAYFVYACTCLCDSLSLCLVRVDMSRAICSLLGLGLFPLRSECNMATITCIPLSVPGWLSHTSLGSFQLGAGSCKVLNQDYKLQPTGATWHMT